MSHGAALKGGRADLAEGRVPTPLVIEHFDVVEQGLLRMGVAVEAVGHLTLGSGGGKGRYFLLMLGTGSVLERGRSAKDAKHCRREFPL